jgi:hypothetical protein
MMACVAPTISEYVPFRLISAAPLGKDDVGADPGASEAHGEL